MKPKIDQKLTYVDESCTEYTAKVTAIFTHQDGHKTVNIEYRHEDRKTRKVNGVRYIDGVHNPESEQKVLCFSKKTPKKSTKKEESTTEPIPDTDDSAPNQSTSTGDFSNFATTEAIPPGIKTPESTSTTVDTKVTKK